MHNRNIIFFSQTSNVRIVDKNLQITSILFDQSTRRFFESSECIKLFVFFVRLNTCSDDCQLNFNKNYDVYLNLRCKWSCWHESWQTKLNKNAEYWWNKKVENFDFEKRMFEKAKLKFWRRWLWLISTTFFNKSDQIIMTSILISAN